jgi:hypothetical protein
VDPANDRSTVNRVVTGLIVLGLAAITGYVVLALTDHGEQGETLGLVISAAVTGLAALLASTRSVNVKGIEELAERDRENAVKVVNLLAGSHDGNEAPFADGSPPVPAPASSAGPAVVEAPAVVVPPSDDPGRPEYLP